MMKNILTWLRNVMFIIFLGFIGGCLSPLILSKIQFLFGKSQEPLGISDTISIANTYILSKRCQLSQESERVSKEQTSALKEMISNPDNKGGKL